MKEVTQNDIELLKTICFVFKKEIMNNPDVKEKDWKDKLNDNIVNIFNFEQRMIDLINKDIQGLEMPEIKLKQKK